MTTHEMINANGSKSKGWDGKEREGREGQSSDTQGMVGKVYWGTV